MEDGSGNFTDDRIEPSYTSSVILSVVISILLVVGVTGNLLSLCTVLPRSRLRTTPNIFLISLSFSDLTSALICSPLWLYRATWGFSEWNLPPWFCELYWLFDFATNYSTSLHIVSFAILRFIAVKYPLKVHSISERKAFFYIIGLWIISFLSAVPPLFFDMSATIPDIQWPSCSISDSEKYKIYIQILYPFVFYIPQVLVIGFSLIMAKEICDHKRFNQDSTRTGRDGNINTIHLNTLHQSEENSVSSGGCGTQEINANTKSQTTGSHLHGLPVSSMQTGHRTLVVTNSNPPQSPYLRRRQRHTNKICVQLSLISTSYLIGYIPLTTYMVWTTYAHGGDVGHISDSELYFDYWFSVAAYLCLRCSECMNPAMYFLGSSALRREARAMIGRKLHALKRYL